LLSTDPDAQRRIQAFQQGLEELGWTEGRNIRVEYCFGAGDSDRIAKEVTDLVALKPDVIVGNRTPVWSRCGRSKKAQIRQGADRVSVMARRFRVWERRAVTVILRRCVTQMTGSMEYEAVVVKLSSSEALRVLHDLERFNSLTHRRSNGRTGGHSRPHSETSRDHSGGNSKQGDLAHLSSPIQSARPHHAVAQAV
jgi:hypothetical protein